MNDGIANYMRRMNYRSFADFRGKALDKIVTPDKLELVDGAVAGEELEFAVAESGLHHQVVGAVARQLLARLDAEHREECGIAVEEVALLVGDVDAFAQVAHEGVQGGAIIEGAAAPGWHLA
jgi:hypothetical protein